MLDELGFDKIGLGEWAQIPLEGWRGKEGQETVRWRQILTVLYMLRELLIILET